MVLSTQDAESVEFYEETFDIQIPTIISHNDPFATANSAVEGDNDNDSSVLSRVDTDGNAVEVEDASDSLLIIPMDIDEEPVIMCTPVMENVARPVSNNDPMEIDTDVSLVENIKDVPPATPFNDASDPNQIKTVAQDDSVQETTPILVENDGVPISATIQKSECDDAPDEHQRISPLSFKTDDDVNLPECAETTLVKLVDLLSSIKNSDNPEQRAKIEASLALLTKQLGGNVVNPEIDSLLDQLQTPNLGYSELLALTTKMLTLLRPVDLNRLYCLLTANHSTGNSIADKDIILLLGGTGSGKTTTLLFLAGCDFIEQEINGFDQLFPVVDEKNAQLALFSTSHRACSETRTIQAVELSVDGKTVYVCDTPGFGDTGGVEYEIANGIGIVRALHRAKTVRPVLILSEKGMGDRFQGVSEILTTITRLLGDNFEIGAFQYAFTKYEPRLRERLCRQFTAKCDDLNGIEGTHEMFGAFVNDIIRKTTPIANLVLPMERNGDKLLHTLMSGTSVEKPNEKFVPFMSEASSNKLKLQLSYTLDSFHCCFAAEMLAESFYYLGLLKDLSSVLPEAQEAASKASQEMEQYVSEKRQKLSQSLTKCLEVRDHSRLFEGEILVVESEMKCLIRFDALLGGNSNLEFSLQKVKDTMLLLGECILRIDEENTPFGYVISQGNAIVASLVQTMVLSNLVDRISLSGHAVNSAVADIHVRCCHVVHSILQGAVKGAELREQQIWKPTSTERSLKELVANMIFIRKVLRPAKDCYSMKADDLEASWKEFKSHLETELIMHIKKVSTSLRFHVDNWNIEALLGIDTTLIVADYQKLVEFLAFPEMFDGLYRMKYCDAEKAREKAESGIIELSIHLAQGCLKLRNDLTDVCGLPEVEILLETTARISHILKTLKSGSDKIGSDCGVWYGRVVAMENSLQEQFILLECAADKVVVDAISHGEKCLADFQSGSIQISLKNFPMLGTL